MKRNGPLRSTRPNEVELYVFARAAAPETVAWLDDANKTVFTVRVSIDEQGSLKVEKTLAGEGERNDQTRERHSGEA